MSTALVVLNVARAGGPGEDALFARLWGAAAVRVCADGGANRLFDWDPALLPDCVVGDLDSLRPEVGEAYRARGVEVLRDGCQDTHDFDKALQLLERREADPRALVVQAFGAFGGRLDQEMANINMLFKWQGRFRGLELLSGCSRATLLPPGLSLLPARPAEETGVCGLVPLGGPVTVSTSGLRWNVERARLEFGGLVSSSNRVERSVVAVRVSGGPLLWTAELAQRPGPAPARLKGVPVALLEGFLPAGELGALRSVAR